MTIALDVGARRFRSLKPGTGPLLAKTASTTCAFLPDKASVRHLLESSGVPYSVAGDQLVIWGAAADSLTKRCAIKTEHLLARNPLRKQKQTIAEPLSESVALLVPPAHPEEVCCLGRLSDDLHADWLEAAVVSRGYRLSKTSAAHAVVLAELVREDFTGIGMVFGGSCCEAVFAREGIEIARCELPRAGDAIDQSLAISEDRYWWSMSGFRELETEGITLWKESLTASVLKPTLPRGENLLAGYRQLILDLISACESIFSRHWLRGRVPVVIAGGSARIAGFEELVTQHLRESTLPIDGNSIRLATSEYTIARGLLIQAEMEQRKSSQPHAA